MKRIYLMIAIGLLGSTLVWGSSNTKPAPHKGVTPKAHPVAKARPAVKPHAAAKPHPAPRHQAHKAGKHPKVQHPKRHS